MARVSREFSRAKKNAVDISCTNQSSIEAPRVTFYSVASLFGEKLPIPLADESAFASLFVGHVQLGSFGGRIAGYGSRGSFY